MKNFDCPSCKYSFELDYFDGKKENDYIIKGDEEPIHLKLSNNIKIYQRKDFDDDEVYLYACPKCKTVTFNN